MFKIIKLDSLPEEMVREILVRVPAQDIFDATVFVCWKWYKMIHTRDFKYAHFRHSTPGLLVKNPAIGGVSYITMLPDGKIDISEFSYIFKYIFWSSCNGLMLEATRGGDIQKLTITNPLTKQHLTLPPFFPRVLPELYSAIAYAATPMEYKVIRTYFQLAHYCAILTVGVDSSWRIVDTQHLSPTELKYFDCTPFVTQGFVHWARWNKGSVLTLNVETEIITMIPGPTGGEGLVHYHFSAGSCVSVFIALNNFKWDVWEMKPETGEWTKMSGIDLKDQENRICQEHDDEECDAWYWQLRPAGWLKYREVMVFGVFKQSNTTCVAYNVKTRDIHFFKFKLVCCNYLVHSNTLLWLDGC